MREGPVLVSGQQCDLDTVFNTKYRIHHVPQVSPLSQGLVVLDYAGSGIIGGRLVTCNDDLVPIVKECASFDRLENLLSGSSGSYTLLVLELSTRECRWYSDPLGGGLLFEYSSGGMIAASSNVGTLACVLRDQYGVSIRRSPLFEIAGYATGSACYGAGTPYIGVSVIPPRVYVKVSADGLWSLEQYDLPAGLDLYGSGSELSNADLSDLIDAGAGEIVTNVTAAVSGSGNSLVLSDITGGFDSRLVLAGILAAGAGENVVLSSIRNHPEWVYAEGLAAISGLRLTDFRGLVGAVVGQGRYIEKAFLGSLSSGGIIANDIAATATPPGPVNFQGGYGECFRAFNSCYLGDVDLVDGERIASEIWKYAPIFRCMVEDRRVFTSDFLYLLSGRLQEYIDEGVRLGVKAEHLTSFVYLHGRNRYFIGQQSYHSSRSQVRLDPLYSCSLISASYSRNFWYRRSNMVGLRAMARLCPELLEYPFYNKGVVTGAYERECGVVQRKVFPEWEGVPEVFPRVASVVNARSADHFDAVDRDIANMVGVDVLTVFGVRKYLGQCVEALLSSSESGCWFDADALRRWSSLNDVTQVNWRELSEFTQHVLRSGVLD